MRSKVLLPAVLLWLSGCATCTTPLHLSGTREPEPGLTHGGTYDLYLLGLGGKRTDADGVTKDWWIAPFWYGRRDGGYATPVNGRLGDAEWIVPLYYADDKWFASLPYVSKKDAAAREKWIVLPPLLQYRLEDRNGLTSCGSPLYGMTGGGTSQTNAWWVTPFVGTREGRRTGEWLFPLYDRSFDPAFDEKARIVGADLMSASPDFPESELVDAQGGVSRRKVLAGSVRSEETRTYLLLFDDDRILEDRYDEKANLYRCTLRRKIGNRAIVNFEWTQTTAFDAQTRRRLSDRKDFELTIFGFSFAPLSCRFLPLVK